MLIEAASAGDLAFFALARFGLLLRLNKH